ncbi:NucA/NucB deoxyribonuclease domain-containing protein [Streptomyces microflavus]|uniref:NucA/NucB deoxyribonuclease domain-containing protein n=1 Tax=Streptomyces microflavus TaxID=1919 RepID=UPI00381E152C
MILLCSILFVGPAPAANSVENADDYYYKVTRVDDGSARSETARQADEPQDRYHTATLQRRETESEIKSRSRLLGKLPDEKPDQHPDMSFCREAPYPAGTKGMIADRWRWCMQDKIEYIWSRCTVLGSCTKVGSLSFRLSVLATGKAGPAEADRSVEAWFILDQWDRDREILTDNTLVIEGQCHRYGTGPRCTTSTDVGKQKLSTWMNGNGYEWIKFSSSTSSLTEFPIDFSLTVLQNGTAKHYTDNYEGPNVRCDSTSAGRRHGCGFADQNIPMIHRITHSAENKEYAEHVKQAQSDPDRTMPTSAQKKSIPGSPESLTTLSYLTNKSASDANGRKAISACQRIYGRSYATSAGYARECDEYPYRSTHQGAKSAEDTSGGNDGFNHFSSKPIKKEHNGSGGTALGNFYSFQRMLEKDQFYVHVVTSSGGDYVAAALTGVAAPIEYSQCESTALVEAVDASPGAWPEKTFNDYAKTTPDGWTGGDSTYSVTLPDGRRLWLFSDTFLGPLNPNGTRPTSAPLINQSFVSQVGDSLTTITGRAEDGSRAAFLQPSAANHWYWLGDGQIATVGGKKVLQVVFHEWHKFGSGAWDFGFKRGVVATFDTDNLTEPLSIAPIPSASGVQWGAGVLSADQSNDGYSYIYGVNDAPINKKMRIARVKGNDLSNTDGWQFFNSSKGWMYGETEGSDETVGVANEYSITPHNGGFILLSQDSTEAFSGKIRIWKGCDPFGPFGSWSGHETVYTMPEPGPFGTCEDGNCFAYNAHVHPSLRQGDRWTLSYNVNNFDSRVTTDGAHYRDPTIYRPRFVSFRLVESSSREKLNFSTATKRAEDVCLPRERPIAGKVISMQKTNC